jgi:hypothetical protein
MKFKHGLKEDWSGWRCKNPPEGFRTALHERTKRRLETQSTCLKVVKAQVQTPVTHTYIYHIHTHKHTQIEREKKWTKRRQNPKQQNSWGMNCLNCNKFDLFLKGQNIQRHLPWSDRKLKVCIVDLHLL